MKGKVYVVEYNLFDGWVKPEGAFTLESVKERCFLPMILDTQPTKNTVSDDQLLDEFERRGYKVGTNVYISGNEGICMIKESAITKSIPSRGPAWVMKSGSYVESEPNRMTVLFSAHRYKDPKNPYNLCLYNTVYNSWVPIVLATPQQIGMDFIGMYSTGEIKSKDIVEFEIKEDGMISITSILETTSV